MVSVASLWNYPHDYCLEIQQSDLCFYFGVAKNYNELQPSLF